MTELLKSDSFKCPSCGADMKLDAASKTLHCDICNRTDEACTINQEAEDFDFGRAEADASLHDWGTEIKTVQCNSCGRKAMSGGDTSCVLCGSEALTPSEEVPGIRPDSLIPFKVDINKAVILFVRWIKRRSLAPFALKNEFKAGNIKGVYIPYWSYDSKAKSSYTGQAGDYYYEDEKNTVTVEGKTGTNTRRIQKIRWRFVTGSFERSFKDIMFNDSGFDPKVLESLEPFRLNDLVKYEPRFLSGFSVERDAGGLKTVWERAKAYMGKSIRDEVENIVRRGSDIIGKVNICTNYTDIRYRHMLLPVWTSSYKFRGKTYNFYINGQTGEVQGKSPKSALKIGGIVLIIAAVITALYFLLR